MTRHHLEAVSADEPLRAGHKCRDCGGVAHPASGRQYTETWIVCGPCVRIAWAWLLPFINGKGARKGLHFYEHAAPKL